VVYKQIYCLLKLYRNLFKHYYCFGWCPYSWGCLKYIISEAGLVSIGCWAGTVSSLLDLLERGILGYWPFVDTISFQGVQQNRNLCSLHLMVETPSFWKAVIEKVQGDDSCPPNVMFIVTNNHQKYLDLERLFRVDCNNMPVPRFYALGPLICKDVCVHWRNVFITIQV
jgi:hypothetical protein